MKKIELTFGFLCSFILTILMFGMSLSLFAQGESPTVIKKKIIVKKIVDEDGNVHTETIETEVDVDEDILEDIENIEGEIDIDIDEIQDGETFKRIVKVQVDGEGGELPQDVLDELESMGIDLNILNEEGEGSRTIIIDTDGTTDGEEGEHDIRIFKMGADDQLPEDIQKKLDEHGIDLDKIKEGHHGFHKRMGHGKLSPEAERFMRGMKPINTNISRETKTIRIESIDDLSEETIKEIEDMGVDIDELRERFDAAEDNVRIYKKGLQPAGIQVDALAEIQSQQAEEKERFDKMSKSLREAMEKVQKDFKRMEIEMPKRIKGVKRPYLGISMDNGEAGVTILNIVENSAAEKAGLKEGDVIKTLNGKAIEDVYQVIELVREMNVGDDIAITYLRDGQNGSTNAKLGEKPSRTFSQGGGHPPFLYSPNTCSPEGNKKRWIERMEKNCERKCNAPFLGIYMGGETEDAEEVTITKIIENTGAEAAGIQEGDILQKIDRTSINDVNQVINFISQHEPGDVIKVQVLRDGKKKRIKATLGNMTQDDSFSPCDCETGKVNTEGMTDKEIILIKITDETDEEEVDVPDFDVNSNNKLELKDINLFPNPNNGTFTLRFTSERKMPTQITIIDVTGKEIYREEVNDFNGRYDKRIELPNVGKGNYFLNIIQGEEIFTEQIILGKE